MKADKVSWWVCNKTYDCTSDDIKIEQMPPLATALQTGCACRGIKHKQGKIDYKILVGCSKSTIRSPGPFVWQQVIVPGQHTCLWMGKQRKLLWASLLSVQFGKSPHSMENTNFCK